MGRYLKIDPFEPFVPRIQDLQFRNVEARLHFWKNKLSNTIKLDGQVIGAHVHLALSNDHQCRLIASVEFNCHTAHSPNAMKIKQRFFLQNDLSTLYPHL